MPYGNKCYCCSFVPLLPALPGKRWRPPRNLENLAMKRDIEGIIRQFAQVKEEK